MALFRKLRLSCLTLLVAATSFGISGPCFADDLDVKLVVQITVDQLRGDMPARYAKRFGEGGFRLLMDDGVWYSNAHYRHATTFTAVGHASLFTGGNPAEHGLVGNNWINRETLDRVYCVEDKNHTIFGVKPKKNQGTSPRNLSSSTIGDELFLAMGGASKIFSVSIKDRGAILPGGQKGKAFWFSKKSAGFVTSTYYYKSEPNWLQEYNKTSPVTPFLGKTWNLLQDKSSYLFAKQDDRNFEKPPKSFDASFPHKLPSKVADLASIIASTPMGDKMIAKFAKKLVLREKLGQGKHADFLAVSFSVTDYVGHAFGPNSLEAEDNILQLDRTLAKFIKFLHKTVGADKCLIVLSSDHGCDASPEHRKSVYQPANSDQASVTKNKGSKSNSAKSDSKSKAKKSAKADSKTKTKKKPTDAKVSKKSKDSIASKKTKDEKANKKAKDEKTKSKPGKSSKKSSKGQTKKSRNARKFYNKAKQKKSKAAAAEKVARPLPASPDYCCQGGRHDVNKFVAALNRHLSKRYTTPAKIVSNFYNPSIYLDLAVISQLKLPIAEIELEVAKFMRQVPGIALALTRTDIEKGQVLRTELSNKVLLSYNHERSGNVLIVQKPFWYLAAYNGVAAMHGSPYNYDTHVPVMFYHPRLRKQRVVRRVAPEDIAPTLSQILNVPAPSGSTGQALKECFDIVEVK